MQQTTLLLLILHAAEKVLFIPVVVVPTYTVLSPFQQLISTYHNYLRNEEKIYCTDLKQTMNMGIILITVSD